MIGVCGETGDVLAMRARAATRIRAGPSAVVPRRMRHRDPCRGSCRCQSVVPVRLGRVQPDVLDDRDRHDAVFSVTARQHSQRPRRASWRSPPTPPPCGSRRSTATTRSPRRPSSMGGRRQAIDGAVDRAPSTHPRRRPIVPRRPRRMAVPGCRHEHARPGSRPRPMSSTTTASAAAPPKKRSASSNTTSGSTTPPSQNFFGNWLWWHAAALAHNVARWIRTLALPAAFRRAAANASASRSSTSPPAS